MVISHFPEIGKFRATIGILNFLGTPTPTPPPGVLFSRKSAASACFRTPRPRRPDFVTKIPTKSEDLGRGGNLEDGPVYKSPAAKGDPSSNVNSDLGRGALLRIGFTSEW